MFAWFPWRPLVSRLARSKGLIDPIRLLARLEGFHQPMEVREPLELLRAGLVFHARGLLNVGAIQHNLDWVWPLWVERQYDPADPAFLPRAFSLTHVNLTHRNWTAVGLPDEEALPIVDPHGLVTPFWDSWSLDAWVLGADGSELVPSRLATVDQQIDLRTGLAVVTRSTMRRTAGSATGPSTGSVTGSAIGSLPRATGSATVVPAAQWLPPATDASARPGADGLALASRVEAEPAGGLRLRIDYRASAERGGFLVVSLRPCNPEGVSFVHHLERSAGGGGWEVDDGHRVELVPAPDTERFSDYRRGDVYRQVQEAGPVADGVRCSVGMVTAAALYRLAPGIERTVEVAVPLGIGRRNAGAPHRHHALGRPLAGLVRGRERAAVSAESAASSSASCWQEALAGAASIALPDPHLRFLFDAALRTLVLHTPGPAGDVYPGPFTYKRFWFRDAAFILDGCLAANLVDRLPPILATFPQRQTRLGHFLSQEAEWDSNGEALWILARWCAASGRPPPVAWLPAIRRAARWIVRKRTADDGSSPHAGLLPAGFSAEHLGPNDFYYWDDFWAVAGLRSAAHLLTDLAVGVGGDAMPGRATVDPMSGGEAMSGAASARAGGAGRARRREVARDAAEASGWLAEADGLAAAIDRSLATAAERLGRQAMPASPYRRLDAGAIGSLAAGYPLQLFAPADPRLLDTAAFLLARCFFAGGFFQDMIHSGINPYLTLHVAQVLLRAGDPRAGELLDTVARLASPTGQWPEAIHPRTLGGCMGDGQHVWAAAEWVALLRQLFVSEEVEGLVLGRGLRASWLASGEELRFGPTPTSWGPITVRARLVAPEGVEVAWDGSWRGAPPPVTVAVPGWAPVRPVAGASRVALGHPLPRR